MDRSFILVQILYERFDTAFIVEMIFTVVAFITQADRHAGVQERELTQALSQNVILEFSMIGERLHTWPETHGCTGRFGVTNHFQRELRYAMRVGLLVNFTFTADNQFQFLRQGVNHGNTHAVQTTGNFVGVIIKLTTGMQHGHDNFSGRNTFFFMQACRNTTAIILHRHRVVAMDGNDNVFTVASERLVNRVVHHLEYHMVQTGSVIGITDVHARAFTHGVQPF